MNNKLMSKVFAWMAIGLLVTFGTGLFVSTNEVMYENIYRGAWYIIFAIIEIALVIFLSMRVMKMKATTAKCSFLLYSVISGLTFSSIFIYYELTSILYIFLVTAAMFGLLALIGYTTKIDLGKAAPYLFMGSFVLIIVFLINIFIGSNTVDGKPLSFNIFLFVGITAFDVQKLKMLKESGLPEDNLAIYGALDLYLDFINIFIHILSIFGKGDNN